MTDDRVILDMGFHLAASKRKEYREGVRRYHGVLIEFLQRKGLTTRQLLKPGETLPDRFKLMSTDLNHQGNELIQRALMKWLGHIENGGSVEDVSILESEFAGTRNA